MSSVLKNLEKTFHKLDTIITMVSTTNECNRLDIFLEEVIVDLDMAIANIKNISKTQKTTTKNNLL